MPVLTKLRIQTILQRHAPGAQLVMCPPGITLRGNAQLLETRVALCHKILCKEYLAGRLAKTTRLMHPFLNTWATFGSECLIADTAATKDFSSGDGVYLAHYLPKQVSFAAIRGDGVVVCWGNPQDGGDCTDVQEQLIDVKHVQATTKAFAAIRADKTVVTWGRGSYGGDSSEVQDHLKNVEHIQAASLAFAALKSEGSVVTWGTSDAGGDSSCVQDQLHDVTRIQVSRDGVRCSFAAIRQDGQVVTWGDPSSGGCCRMVRDQLFDVQEIQGTENCFAAIRSDGGVVTWGNGDFAPDCYAAQELLQDGNLSGLSGLFPAGYAAIGSDGSVLNFGAAELGLAAQRR